MHRKRIAGAHVDGLGMGDIQSGHLAQAQGMVRTGAMGNTLRRTLRTESGSHHYGGGRVSVRGGYDEDDDDDNVADELDEIGYGVEGLLIAGDTAVGYIGEQTDTAQLAAVLRRMHAGWHTEDTTSGAAQCRAVDGEGGWGYCQYEDGTIEITRDPREGSPAVGRKYTSGPTWQAITDEIGPVTQSDAARLPRIKFSHPDDAAEHEKKRVHIAGRTVKIQSPVLLRKDAVSGPWDPPPMDDGWHGPRLNDGWHGEFSDAPYGPRAMGLRRR